MTAERLKTGLKSKLNWRGDEVQVGRWVENLRWGEWGKEAQEQKRKEQTGWRNIGNSRTNEGDAGQMAWEQEEKEDENRNKQPTKIQKTQYSPDPDMNVELARVQFVYHGPSVIHHQPNFQNTELANCISTAHKKKIKHCTCCTTKPFLIHMKGNDCL